MEVVKLGADGAALSSRAVAAVEPPDCLLEVAWRPASLVSNPPLPTQPQRWAVIGGGSLGRGLVDRLRGLGQEAVHGVARAADPSEGIARIVDLPTTRRGDGAGRGPGAGSSTAAAGSGRSRVGRSRRAAWCPTRTARRFGASCGHCPSSSPAAGRSSADLDPAKLVAGQAEALWSALTNGSREDQLAFREGAWLAARLSERAAADLPAAEPLDPAAAGPWLVTGGLGGLGWAVAEWLVARGARELLLVGRRGPDAARKQALEAWSSRGIRAMAIAADCADAGALAAALASSAGGRRFAGRGVFHIAGAWQDAPLAELDAAGLEAVWRPKVGGAQALERALASDPVAHWIYFSAFSALLPALGQGNYAAANAWLGAQARRQRAAGARAIALDWGPWSGTGFALTEYGRRAHERLESIGIARLRPAEGLALLDRAIASGQPQIGAMPVDWTRLAARRIRRPGCRRSWPSLRPGTRGPPNRMPTPTGSARALAASPPEGHLALLTAGAAPPGRRRPATRARGRSR